MSTVLPSYYNALFLEVDSLGPQFTGFPLEILSKAAENIRMWSPFVVQKVYNSITRLARTVMKTFASITINPSDKST